MAGVVLKGFGALEKRIAKLEVKLQKEVNAEMSARAVEIKNTAKRNAPTYEGRIKGALFADTQTPFIKRVVVNNVFYAPYIEFGTKRKVKIPPGLQAYAATFKHQAKRGDFEQMVDNLTEWVRKKRISGVYSTKTQRRLGNSLAKAIQDRQTARHIAIRILQNGIKAQPFMFTQETVSLQAKLMANIINILKP